MTSGAPPRRSFKLLHGFPDNSHIYDDLIPHLASAGRRTTSIDFLGFGASDKLDGAHYTPYSYWLSKRAATVPGMAPSTYGAGLGESKQHALFHSAVLSRPEPSGVAAGRVAGRGTASRLAPRRSKTSP